MGIQLLKIVENLHNSDFIHGDITANNFVIPKEVEHLKIDELDDISSESADEYKRLKLQLEPKDVLLRYQ